jgi:hypothetical protein
LENCLVLHSGKIWSIWLSIACCYNSAISLLVPRIGPATQFVPATYSHMGSYRTTDKTFNCELQCHRCNAARIRYLRVFVSHIVTRIG